MNVCPTPSSDENFRKLYHLLGGDQTSKVARDTALKSAYRMWRIHEDLGANEGSVRAMETISRTPTEKIAAIQAYAANLRLDKDTHTYTWNGDPTIQIQSVSSLLDDLLEKPYYEGSQNKLFSESGTAIHDLFNQLVTVGEITDNIKKYADDRKIPYSLVESLDKLKDKLKGMGTLVSEQTLYTEGTMEDMRIAGTADVIIYGADGKKYIVDIKTVYNTDAVKKKGGSAWDPLGNNGQKAKRYTAQTMAYGRMTEWADRQPVTDHFIVPISQDK